MKKLLLINAILLLTICANSQEKKNVTISIGDQNKYDKWFSMNYLVLEQLNDLSTVLVEPFGKSLKLTNLNKIGTVTDKTKIMEAPQNTELSDYIKLEGGKRLIVYEEKDKKITKLSVQILDLATGNFTSEAKSILEYNDAGKYGPDVSSDEGNFLVYYKTPVKGKSKQRYSNIAVFDKNFNKLYTIENKDFVSEKIGIQRFRLIGKQLVVMIGFVEENNDKFLLRRTIDNMKLKVYIYSETGSLEKEFIIENDKSVFVDYFDVEKAKDNSLKFVTAYSNSEKGIPLGFVSFSVDLANLDASKIRFDEIGEKTMCQYSIFTGEYNDIKKSYKAKKNKTRYHYTFDRIITHKNGYFAIISQRGEFSVKGKPIYWLRDFIVASYDNMNNLNWIKKIPIVFEQRFLYDIGLQWIVKDGELILIHPSGGIDIDENIENNWNENNIDYQRIKLNRLFLIFEKLTKDGKLIRENIYNLKDSELGTYSIASKPIKNSVSLLFYKKKQYQIYRFDIK